MINHFCKQRNIFVIFVVGQSQNNSLILQRLTKKKKEDYLPLKGLIIIMKSVMFVKPSQNPECYWLRSGYYSFIKVDSNTSFSLVFRQLFAGSFSISTCHIHVLWLDI